MSSTCCMIHTVYLQRCWTSVVATHEAPKSYSRKPRENEAYRRKRKKKEKREVERERKGEREREGQRSDAAPRVSEGPDTHVVVVVVVV